MYIIRWLRESKVRIRQDGVTGAKRSLRPVKHKLISLGDVLTDPGRPIYEFDWDLLVILDACRLDLMREVADEYEWIEDLGSIRSVNSATAAWMRDTFVQSYGEEMAETSYVCGNPFSESQLRAGDFAELAEIWQSAWVEPGTVPPEAITDETIRRMRDSDTERVIAHYMQPHCPFLAADDLSKGKKLDNFGDQEWRDVWEKLSDGSLEKQEVWEGYRDNLRAGLDEVETLLNNVDADRVIVTSDHGNALGEWTVYGHPGDMPFDCLRTVPWIETDATDSKTRDPEGWTANEADAGRTEQLQALGYR